MNFAAGIFITLLYPSQLSQRLESATLLHGKKRTDENENLAGGFVASDSNGDAGGETGRGDRVGGQSNPLSAPNC